ncbi:MAG: TatD family hydrolase [Anaerolineales bacterium]|nr:TatD family hydrolase [Anaerolineales bacterium]
MTAGSTAIADTHCHLNLNSFDDDRQIVLDRARAAGVDRILVPGIDAASSRVAAELAANEAMLYAAVGIHPHDSSHWSDAEKTNLVQLAGSRKVVAIGEIGLDYYRDYTPRDLQRAAFSAQLELAAELELPVVIHQRESMTDVLRMLQAWVQELPQELSSRCGVLHAFTGCVEDACTAMELGFYIGLGGPVTFKNARSLKEVIAHLDLDRIILETDSPYLSPHPMRGKRNEPANVALIAEAIAEIRSISASAVRQTTSNNADRLFLWRTETGNAHLS